VKVRTSVGGGQLAARRSGVGATSHGARGAAGGASSTSRRRRRAVEE
jgi:hypothetical protein